jgi:dihydrofolate synthase/folylpolyglutamate synthase
LAGRFQTVREQPKTILDVAHNPHAASALAENLQKNSQTGDVVIAVFAMLADKDIAGVIKILSPLVHCWFIGDIHHQRGETSHNLEKRVLALNPNSQTHTFDSVKDAYEAAQALAEKYIAKGENVKIIAFGSFFTIADILRLERDRV